MNGAAAFALGALSSAAAVLALSRPASRAVLADDPAAAPDRKLQAAPVPAVGGFAILVGLLAIEAATPSSTLAPGAWLALLLACALGAVDDRTRGGLPPLALLAGQAIVAAALVATGWSVCAGPPGLVLAASVLAVLVALNGANTFDNADGAATSLGLLGLAPGSILLAAPLAGFLPANLSARGDPRAYLGNSGSHLLGILLVLDPIGRAALLLPVLDLVRLSFVRVAAGSRPWVGDRRHLAHRLQRAGLPPPLVALLLVVIAAPAVLGSALPGAVATTLLFVVAVRFTRRVA